MATRFPFRCVAAYTEAMPPMSSRRSTCHFRAKSWPTRSFAFFASASFTLPSPSRAKHALSRYDVVARLASSVGVFRLVALRGALGLLGVRRVRRAIFVELDAVTFDPAVNLHPCLTERAPHGRHVSLVLLQKRAELRLVRRRLLMWDRVRRGLVGGGLL